MSEFSVNVDAKEVIKNLKEIHPRIQTALNVAGDTVGQQMKAYAQNNAIWTDRTGDARNTLDYKVSWQGTVLDVAIFHEVEYGLWLEIAMGEKYAIIRDARDSQINTFKDMIKAMKL